MSTGRCVPPVAILTGVALLACFVLRDALHPDSERLPGIDAGNLYVWELYTRDVLGASRLPHWNPYHFTGTPHFADPQTTVLYPPALLLRWLPPTLFLGWMAAFHVWLAGAGALFLARTTGLGWAAAAAAAVALALGGSMGPWLHNGHLLVVYSTAWLPWALGLAILSLRRATAWPHPALAGVLVLQFLAGYLQGTLYVAAAVSLYFLYSAVWPEHTRARVARWRPVAQLGILGFLVAGLSAFQLFPALRLVADAGRTSGLPYDVAVEGALTIDRMAALFFPFYGAPGVPPHRYLADQLMYVGWVLTCAVPFVLFAAAWRRLVVFYALLGAIALAFALGGELPLFRLHHAMFPGLRIPGRLLFVATLCLAMLGAIGLQQFVAFASARRWRPLLGGAAAAASVALVAAVVVWQRTSPDSIPVHGWPWIPILAVAVSIGAGVVAVLGAPRVALAGAAAFTVIDLIVLSAGAVQAVSREDHQTIRRWMGPAESGRALSLCENRVGAGEMLMNRQPGLDGMAGISLRDYGEFLQIAKTGDPPAQDGLFHRIGSEGVFPVRRDLLDMTNVSLVFSCEPLDAPWLKQVSHVPPVYAYRSTTVWPRAVWFCDAETHSRPGVIAQLVHARYDHTRRLARRHSINVRWTAGIGKERRRALERQYHLDDGVQREDGTWRYVLADASQENGFALLRDPAVEDTHGLDRTSGAVIEPSAISARAETTPEQRLVGTHDCDEAGATTTIVQDEPNGHVSVRVEAPVSGVVFLSEPHYGERQAFLDGRPVRLMKGNLAFTVVAVPPGRHLVELRHVPSSFYIGVGASAATVLIWTAGLLVGRRRLSRSRGAIPSRQLEG